MEMESIFKHCYCGDLAELPECVVYVERSMPKCKQVSKIIYPELVKSVCKSCRRHRGMTMDLENCTQKHGKLLLTSLMLLYDYIKNMRK